MWLNLCFLRPTTQMVNQSVQPFLHSSRQSVFGYFGATWRMWLKLCTLAPCDKYDWTHASFVPPESTTQTTNQSIQLFLHSSRKKVAILYNGQPFPQKLPLPMVDLNPIYFMIPRARPSPQSKLHHDQLSYFRTGDRRVSIYFTVCASFPQNCPFPRGNWTPCKTRFLGPIRAHRSNGISISSAVFAQMTAECPYTLQWDASSPLKIAPSHGGIWTLI